MSCRKTPRLSGAQYRKRKREKDSIVEKESGSMNRFARAKMDVVDLIEEEVYEIDETEKNDQIPKVQDFQGIEETEETKQIQEVQEIAEKDEINKKVMQSSFIRKNECEKEKTDENSNYEEKLSRECINDNFIDILNGDPACWPVPLSNHQIQLLVENKTAAAKKKVYPADSSGRSFSDIYYTRNMANGESCERSWLVYSVSTNRMFCFCCTIFGRDAFVPLTAEGFSDWQHASQHLSRHEKNVNHIRNFQQCSSFEKALKSGKTIDRLDQKILEAEKRYWQQVIERVVYVVQFLAQQNLAFRGSSDRVFESNNGNFLKAIEMIAKFDPVMMEHVRRTQAKEDKWMPTYLGHVIQNEIIDLIAERILKIILKKVRKAKYYTIMIDCTPDAGHLEQVTFIVRFVDIDEKERDFKICEHFLGFSEIKDTTGKGLTDFVIKKLQALDLEVEDIWGQCYDNGSNMRGQFKGIQSRILQINPRAFFVPCNPHSLNLVVNDVAKANVETVDFFGNVQELYNFLSASTKRWDVIISFLPQVTLKPLSGTRWSCRSDSVRPLRHHVGKIHDCLFKISEEDSDMSARHQALCLAKKIKSFKFLCSIVIWNEVLLKINVASKLLQDPRINLPESIKILEDLSEFFTEKRTDEAFKEYVTEATHLATALEVDIKLKNLMGTRQKIDDPEKSFKVDFYFTILDVIIMSLQERFKFIKQFEHIFGFIFNSTTLLKMDKLEILKKCKNLQENLTNEEENRSDIVGVDLYDELIALRTYLKPNMSANKLLTFILKENLHLVFPNTFITYRILNTLPVSVASAERSFSKLKIIKNYLRTAMAEKRLSNLTMISIERMITNLLDVSELVEEFAQIKARRANFF